MKLEGIGSRVVKSCLMKLDLSSLKKAIESLTKAISRSLKEPEDEEVRDAVIQRFEYTYELCWKMLKRQLEREVPNPAEVDQWSFRDLLRTAAERGILTQIEAWFEYRRQRNLTTHVYDEKKSKSVYQTATRFLPDAQALLRALQNRSDG